MEVRQKVQQLLALAVQSDGEEARTAAVLAARLIVEHKLLDTREPPTEKLLANIEGLLGSFLQLAWEHRDDEDYLLTVPLLIDAAIRDGHLDRRDRERAQRLLGRRVAQERKRGVLQSIRGRYGGYRMAPGVRRSHHAV